MHIGNDSGLAMPLSRRGVKPPASAEGRMSIPMFPFPAPVHHLIAPTEETRGSEAVSNDHCKQWTWRRLCQVEQTKDQSSQPNTSHTTPAPLTQAMIENVCCCAYEPAPANPACPLGDSSPHKATKE